MKNWEDLTEPTVGRALPVGGFVLGDSFDTILRNISDQYLESAWKQLESVLARNRIATNDLSWGWMHPGETGFTRESPTALHGDSPSDFFGWTSRKLANLDRFGKERRLDEALNDIIPSLRCTGAWRSVKWRSDPDDFPRGLELLEDICVTECSDWNPDVVLDDAANPTSLWRMVAKAIRNDDQRELDALIEQARRDYTPTGFRILVRGYTTYVDAGGYVGDVKLPDWR